MEQQSVIRKGDIFMVQLSETNYQYCLRGLHPCVVMSNFRACNKSPLIQIIPISSKPKSQPMHVEIEGSGLSVKSILLCEQVTTINKSALRFSLGKVSYEKMVEIEDAVSRQLGMQNDYNIEMFQTVKLMLDELEELDRYLSTEYTDEVATEREILLKDLQRYCINHSIKIDLQKFVGNVGEAHAKAI